MPSIRAELTNVIDFLARDAPDKGAQIAVARMQLMLVLKRIEWRRTKDRTLSRFAAEAEGGGS